MDLPEHKSEFLEPAAAHFVGVAWKRCELTREHFEETGEYMDQLAWDNEIESLWYGMNALQKLVVATKGRAHFSVAQGNEMQYISRYIEETTGYCPIQKKPEDHRHHLCLSQY